MKKIDIKDNRLDMSKHCFVSYVSQLAGLMREHYGRPNAGLKIFDLEKIEKEEDFYTVKWGDDPREGEPRVNTKIWEATQIQNILEREGLSSRVYGLETVIVSNARRPMQIVEWVNETESTKQEAAQEVYEKCIAIGKKYGFGIVKQDVSCRDVLSRKLIDVQTFAFEKDYKETVIQIYREDGIYGKKYYQDVKELDLDGGPRKSEDRVKYMQLDKIDFKDKAVLDIGCAGGFFVRYALEHGAKRAIGLDLEERTVKAAFHVSNYLGYFNADFIAHDVTRKPDLDINDFDIVFFLSMNYHVNFPEWIFDAVKGTLIFEDNGRESRTFQRPEQLILDRFSSCERVGIALDHGDKPIYHLKK